MEHSVEFLKDEVRNGFYISTAIKQAWAAELDILSNIDSICKKHDIKYFADWGTFLGAVRHGGFIPWDDDLDICMLRPDYEKFMKVVKDELPKEYSVHNYETKENHWFFITKIVNNTKASFDVEYLKTHNNFPWLACVDIFIRDYIYEDEEKETKRDKDVLDILATADGIIEKQISDVSAKIKLDEINKQYKLNLNLNNGRRETGVSLYKLAEKRMSEVSEQESGHIIQLYPWGLKHHNGTMEEKKVYENVVRVPFEDTFIPVPAAYNESLIHRYRDYNVLKKTWECHDYPFFEKSKKEMEHLLGAPLPGFKFDEKLFVRNKCDKNDSVKETAVACINEFKRLLFEIRNEISKNNMDSVTAYVQQSEQLAADFGTLLENEYGNERESVINVVNALQNFCDVIFSDYNNFVNAPDNSFVKTKESLEMLINTLFENVISKREVLILLTGKSEWDVLKSFYEDEKENGSEVFVVVLPLFKKDALGNILATEDEMIKITDEAFYPDFVNCTKWYLYNSSIHCPDVVYCENPYDETNPCFTVPSAYYVKNMQKYSEMIINVPSAICEDFSGTDERDMYNVSNYVCTPGVVYADKILVSSENMKERYIEILTEFTNESLKCVWDERISECELLKDTKKNNEKKKILYCIGAYEIFEHGDYLLEKIMEKLDTFAKEKEKSDVTLMFYPGDSLIFEDEKLREKYEVFIKKVSDMAIGRDIFVKPCCIKRVDKYAKEYDAYYGSSSALVPSFYVLKKPILLANYK